MCASTSPKHRAGKVKKKTRKKRHTRAAIEPRDDRSSLSHYSRFNRAASLKRVSNLHTTEKHADANVLELRYPYVDDPSQRVVVKTGLPLQSTYGFVLPSFKKLQSLLL